MELYVWLNAQKDLDDHSCSLYSKGASGPFFLFSVFKGNWWIKLYIMSWRGGAPQKLTPKVIL
jgi:hypothetical protein